ncbi:MAG: hypothetical protein J3R72DRAFT_460878 [Linnemannia gamsii]|nr:MAG: hypothetical protein J3R72DRAFT_460878 [Linnemannia gamsii]
MQNITQQQAQQQRQQLQLLQEQQQEIQQQQQEQFGLDWRSTLTNEERLNLIKRLKRILRVFKRKCIHPEPVGATVTYFASHTFVGPTISRPSRQPSLMQKQSSWQKRLKTSPINDIPFIRNARMLIMKRECQICIQLILSCSPYYALQSEYCKAYSRKLQQIRFQITEQQQAAGGSLIGGSLQSQAIPQGIAVTPRQQAQAIQHMMQQGMIQQQQ